MNRRKWMRIGGTVVTIFYVFAAGMLLFGANVSAYIDPSVVTYLIQAFAGVFIAVGAVAGLYWRRIVKYLEENTNLRFGDRKEVESDHIVIYEEEDQ